VLLTIDIGNTCTNAGVFEGEELRAKTSWATDAEASADQLAAQVVDFLHEVKPARAVYACVVPRLSERWEQALQQAFGVQAVACSARTAADLFPVDYPQVDSIGADRVADAIALRRYYGAPAVAVDFGTATNIEVLDKQGKFLGGIIAPGAELSMNALFAKAAKLEAYPLENPLHAIGKSTKEAVLSGIMYGEADRADGLVRRIFEEMDFDDTVPVVATGGLATTIAPFSRLITDVDQTLTLKGLWLLDAFLQGCA